jgi:DNA-binding transcriptional ArsR family regulator
MTSYPAIFGYGNQGADEPMKIGVEAGAAYECLLTLHVITCVGDYEAYTVGRAWFDAARAAAGPELLADIERFTAGSDTVWDRLLGLTSTVPAPHDVSALLAHLEATDAREIRLHLLGYYDRSCRHTTPAETILRAAEGDDEAQRTYLKAASLSNDIPWRSALRHLLEQDAAAMKMQLLAILSRWYALVFRRQEDEVMPALVADAKAKSALAKQMSLQRLILLATQDYEYVLEPGVQRVILIPTAIMRPWTVLASLPDTRLICYPLASEDGKRHGDAPPDQLVQLYKALGDERRLHILKKLATESYTLQELSDLFGIGKTTMLHHLVVLRGAGLIEVREPGKHYRLRAEMLPRAAEQLRAYLGASADPSGATQ